MSIVYDYIDIASRLKNPNQIFPETEIFFGKKSSMHPSPVNTEPWYANPAIDSYSMSCSDRAEYSVSPHKLLPSSNGWHHTPSLERPSD